MTIRLRAAGPFVMAVLAIAMTTGATVDGAGTDRRGGGPQWRAIPRAPVAGRVAANVVWTGDEIVVWGGVARGAVIEAVADGAAYDPATRSWRSIAAPPRGVLGGGGSAAAWTGARAVFWAGNSPDGPARGAVYDPRRDTWRRLPRGPLGPREGYVSVWTGSELLVIGGTAGDAVARPVAAAVDPRMRTWRRLPGLEDLRALIPSGAVWTGTLVFVAGIVYECPVPDSTCTDTRPVLASYDPATDVLEEIDLAAAPAASVAPVGWTRDEVLAVGDDRVDLVAYDPATGAWRSGSAAPCPAGGAYRQAAWIGDRYVAACGRDALQLYDPGTDAWDVIEAGVSPFTSASGSAIAWTGRDLIAWSGTVPRPGNPTPNRGAAVRLG